MPAGHDFERAIKMPYFFLSYARTPKLDPADKSDPDRWVYKLYRDLCNTILTITSAQPESAGYMDRRNRVGDQWPNELAQALATCRVFVPLYSPRYFDSVNCGMEWSAFARRMADHRARGLPGDAIVPALWAQVTPDSLPEVAKSIQYNHHGLSARYDAEGFYGLIKLERYRRDYQLAVHRLAHRIVEVARQTEIRANEHPPDYTSLKSAFGPVGGPGTSDRMEITVLALDTSAPLPEGRTMGYYGSTSRTWSPYLPDYPQPLGDYAAELARCYGWRAVVGSFEEHAAGWAANGRPVPPGLCLVDAWATISPAYRERLRHLDELEQPWVSVLVPWNNQDTELAAAAQNLRQGLRQSLAHKLDSVPYRCRMAADGIPTLQEFGELLPRMAMIMLKRFRQDEDVPTFPPEGPPVQRFRLGAPDPEDPGGSR